MGFAFFYFNLDDFKNHRIHLALIAISPYYRGNGYGTQLAKYAWDSFRRVKWLKGISTRYSLNNAASRRIHEAYGFRPVIKYYDERLGEERVYAVVNW